MASVDVFVPCYNYGRFLRECVESVLSQEGVDVRVLILDDCSTDDSEEVGRALAAENPRVEYRRHAVNRGHITTYNEGFDWCTADYTMLLSADDLLTRGALRRSCGFLDAHPEVGFVYGKVIRWLTSEPKPAEPDYPDDARGSVIPGPEWIARICSGDPPTTAPELVVRTTLRRQLGFYRHDLPHWADVAMLMQFAAHAPVGHLDCDQAYYRIHSGNMHHAFRGLRDLEQRRIAFRALFQDQGHRLPRVDELGLIAFQHIAEMALVQASKAFDRGDVVHCRSAVEFARETFPPITSRSEYLRLRWKLRIGRRLWGAVAPLWRKLRLR